MSDQDIGHPHRCRKGHRWQHTGPTAFTCEIAVDDSYAGDLPLISAPDCPLCSGREDLLRRDLHTHYCNICEGRWDHEGLCLEGPVACCPWCFGVAGAARAPGTRRGLHFHFCPECTQNWQHDTSCTAPLRAALPDCSGCRELVAEPSTGERALKAITAFSSFRAHASPIDVVRAVRDFIRPAVVPVSIAAGVILAIPILIKVSSTPSSLAPHSVAPVSEQGTANLTRAAVSPPPELSSPTKVPRPSEPHSGQLAQETPSVRAQAQLHRDGERRAEQAAPAPRSARIAPPRELDVPPKPAAALGHRTGENEEMRAASSPPSPTPRELGGAALDTVLQGPPRLRSAPQPPLWDRASISMLMRAVVDVRPSPDISSGPERSPAASGREPRQLKPRPSRGFIIDEFGHIVTSDKRLRGATSVEVITVDGRTLGATVVARNGLNDIAVLKLQRRGLPIIALGDSGALAVGDRVLAVGNGIGSDRTPTVATVLAIGTGTGSDLAVNLTSKPDRVGGPLLNHLGQAVGIVTDSAPPNGSPQAFTFAVPVDRVKSLLREVSPRPSAESMSTP